MFASEEATGTWQGRSVDIAVFANNQLRDNWEKVAGNFAPILKDGTDYAVAAG